MVLEFHVASVPSKWHLERKTDFEGFDHRRARVVHADDAAQQAEGNNKTIENHSFPLQRVTFQLQMEVAGPDQR